MMDIFNIEAADMAIDVFGEGADVLAQINTKMGESVAALLVHKAREETKHLYLNLNAELAWKFRQWVIAGGIIVTNRPKDWEQELRKIKYKRVGQGIIQLMPKEMFKKEYGFSPDRFDMAKMLFFKDEPYIKPVLSAADLEAIDNQKWLAAAKQKVDSGVGNYSSM